VTTDSTVERIQKARYSLESLIDFVLEIAAASKGISARSLVVAGNHRFIVRRHPRTTEISRDFPALKLEAFLEPRAFSTWNRRRIAV
jgi:hypothetical protein